MEILGNIIKGAINLKEKLTPEVNPIEAQEQVLKYIFSYKSNFDRLKK